jgi:hypothetical protein
MQHDAAVSVLVGSLLLLLPVSTLAAAGWEFRVNEKLGLGIEVGALARPGLEQVDPRALLTITRYWGDRA